MFGESGWIKILAEFYRLSSVAYRIGMPYGGKLWWGETLTN